MINCSVMGRKRGAYFIITTGGDGTYGGTDEMDSTITFGNYGPLIRDPDHPMMFLDIFDLFDLLKDVRASGRNPRGFWQSQYHPFSPGHRMYLKPKVVTQPWLRHRDYKRREVRFSRVNLYSIKKAGGSS